MIEARPCPTCGQLIPEPLEFCSADCSITYYRDIPENRARGSNSYGSTQGVQEGRISLQVSEDL